MDIILIFLSIRRMNMRSCLILFLFGMMFSLHAQESKKTIAILEFQSSGGLEKSELSILTNRFRGILVQTNAYEVIEREKMKEILKEQDFAISDQCNTSECAVQVGQLLGVQYMIAGDIAKFGQTYTIDLRMIDVGTGKILISKSEDYEGKMEGLLNIMKNVAAAFTGKDEGVSVSAGVGDVFVSSNPSGGQIFIDGKQTEWKTPKLIEGVPAGKHIIEVRSGNLIARREIDLKKGAIDNLDMKLGKPTVPVKFTSEPIGASVFIDNEKKGETQFFVELPIGSHSVKMTKEGFTEHIEDINLKEGETAKTIKGSLIKLVKLSIKAIPPADSKVNDIKIYVDEQLIGNSPVSAQVQQGKHVIKITTNLTTVAVYYQAMNIVNDETFDAILEYTSEYQKQLDDQKILVLKQQQDEKTLEEQKLLAERQRLEKEKQDKLLLDQQKKENNQLTLKQEMERKAKEAKEAKEKLDKEAREKGGTQVGRKSSNTKWYIIGGAVLAGGGAAAVLLGGKKGSSEKAGINWPNWP